MTDAEPPEAHDALNDMQTAIVLARRKFIIQERIVADLTAEYAEIVKERERSHFERLAAQ